MAEKKEETILDVEPNTKILVTCGNSKLGGRVLEYLLARKVPPKNISTTVRSLSKGEKWKQKGIEIKVADYKDPASLEKAFKGVDRIYMVSSVGEPNSPRSQQHMNVVEAAKKCNVKLIVYSSFVNCLNNTNFVADDHKYTEKILEESGLNYSLARNPTYIDCQGELFKYLMKKENNFFFNTCKEQKIGFRLIRELGIVGACILLMKFPKKIYELFSKPVYYIDIKNVIEKMTGKKINAIDASVDDIYLKLKEIGFGVYFSMFIKFMSANYLNGIYNINSSDMED